MAGCVWAQVCVYVCMCVQVSVTKVELTIIWKKKSTLTISGFALLFFFLKKKTPLVKGVAWKPAWLC